MMQRVQGGSNRHTESDDYKDKAGGNQQKLPLQCIDCHVGNHIPYNGCFQSSLGRYCHVILYKQARHFASLTHNAGTEYG